jgi:hypothetical protein
MSTGADNLWVCHRCQMIGSGFEAGRHVDATGHQTHELDATASAFIRAEWEKNGRPQRLPGMPTATDLIAWSRFMRGRGPLLETADGS